MTKRTASPPPMQESLLDIAGKKIFVAELGEGPSVLLLHGGGPGASGVSNYSRNIEDLAKEYRVIVPDLPGYGRSTKGINGADPFGYLADGIRGLMDQLGMDKAHLVGNSYGATRALLTPGLNSLLNYYSGDGPSRLKLEKFIRTYLVFNAAEVPDAVIDARYAASIDPEVVAAPPLRRPSGRDALRTLWKMDFTRDRRLSRVPVPTLVLWGAADKVNRPSRGALLADRMPNCDLYQVANTGHWVQWERAELFNRVCADFLAGRR
jgi:2-hydroxy-6-oxonona-2,4-dienedioate hydrolase/4,5:9,10-diseco-3-hydroxy-5,9,17-trioxoandrosta-1(10),2-diene-4-oate hydrolase